MVLTGYRFGENSKNSGWNKVMFNIIEQYPVKKLYNLVRLQRAGDILLSGLKMTLSEVNLLLTDQNGIKALNEKWLQRPWPTNVISFSPAYDEHAPISHQNGFLGDIVISVDAGCREAEAQGTDLTTRIEQLLIHGIAHLLGEDHEQGKQAAGKQAEKEFELQKLLMKGGMQMAELCVNIDHIATIRQARGGVEPDPVHAATLVELAGADGIVVHLREDRRHIQDRDLKLLREIVQTRLNMEMAGTKEMVSIACDVKPDIVTLVPEKRQELTTEGGLDVIKNLVATGDAVATLKAAGIQVSIFINPDKKQVESSFSIGVDCVEIHTGRYADADNVAAQDEEFERIVETARIAKEYGLRVHAGHGLNYRNVARLSPVADIDEFSIGHSVIARAALVGMERAVREMLSLVKRGMPL